MPDAALVIRSCSHCGTENQSAAESHCTCGESFPTAALSNTEPAADIETTPRHSATNSSIGPRAALGQLLTSNTADQAASRLNDLILLHRPQLKSLSAPLPKVSNPVVTALLESLKALPPGETSAQIAVVNALGTLDDPSALSPLFLASGTPSKEVRKAAAKALGCFNHPLSAYMLLRMLQDNSTRVQQAAFQSLIRLEQPHTIEAILATCLCSKSLRKLILEIMRQISDRRRNAFFMRIKESTADNQPELRIIADWLRFEFRKSISPDCIPHKKTRPGLRTEKQTRLELAPIHQQVELDFRDNDIRDNDIRDDDISNNSEQQSDSLMNPELEYPENHSATDSDELCSQDFESGTLLEPPPAEVDLEESKSPPELENSHGKPRTRKEPTQKKLPGKTHRRYLRLTVTVAALFIVAPLLLVVLSLNGEAPKNDVAYDVPDDAPVETALKSKSDVPPTLQNPRMSAVVESKIETSSSTPQEIPNQTLIAAQPAIVAPDQVISARTAVPEIHVATPIMQDVPQPLDVALESMEIDPVQSLLESEEQEENSVVADAGRVGHRR